ncbi:HIG1 domain family member 1A, mitochondrial-like [Harmonia axyridis]|uniref:HIG1 domain family member 1A, mitochondrial-like n=1 Tax=Harmonia axyridis TaxID=115357 RepID=UPI001E278DF3|nr:HIG1 domain family member 1A, mitochondrial-like [Harmonia axyridis]
MTSHASNMTEKSSITYDDNRNKLLKKSQEAPMFPIACGVLTAAVGYGAYMFKNKGKMSTSVYLMHLRVGAQGAAVGALTIGLAYTMVKQYIFKDE